MGEFGQYVYLNVIMGFQNALNLKDIFQKENERHFVSCFFFVSLIVTAEKIDLILLYYIKPYDNKPNLRTLCASFLKFEDKTQRVIHSIVKSK